MQHTLSASQHTIKQISVLKKKGEDLETKLLKVNCKQDEADANKATALAKLEKVIIEGFNIDGQRGYLSDAKRAESVYIKEFREVFNILEAMNYCSRG